MSNIDDRKHHLDAVRSFCLFYGFLVHGATTDPGDTLSFIADSSSFFRLATFFVISGYFGAMVRSKVGGMAFLKRRALNLLVPLVAGTVLLNPITLYLVYIYHNGFVSPDAVPWVDAFQEAKAPFVWHLHLWFLISLFAYVLATPVTLAVASSRRAEELISRIERSSKWLVLPTIAILAGISVVIGRGFYDVALDSVVPDLVSWLGRITINYLPFYIIGVFAFANKSIFRALHTFSPLTLGVAIVLLAILLGSGIDGEAGGAVDKIVFYFAKNFATLAIASLLLTVSSMIFSDRNAVVAYVGERIYTGYIFHFLVIYVLAVALQPLGLPPGVQFALIVAATVPIVFVFHDHVLAKAPILMLLFNGRDMRVGKKVETKALPRQSP